MLKSWQGNLFMKFCSFCPLVLLVVIVTSKLNFNLIYLFSKGQRAYPRAALIRSHVWAPSGDASYLSINTTTSVSGRPHYCCVLILFFCFSLLQTSIFILVLQIFAWLPQSRLNAISWWNFGHGIFQGSLYFYGLLLLWRNRLASFKVACTAYVTPWLLSAATFTFNEYKKQEYLIKAIFWCMFVVQFQLSSLKNLKNVKYATNTLFFIIS